MTILGSCVAEQRISVLDGFRGLAILMVTTYRFAEVALTQDVVGDLPSRAFYLGAFGVDFFFVLSGFLITGILIDSKSKPGSYFGRFYFRRCLRIFPLYFIILFVLLVALPYGFDTHTITSEVRGDRVHLWLYSMNLNMARLNDWCYGPLNHLWSLAVEEQYYLIWPVMVYCLMPRTLLRVCVALFATLAVVRIGTSVAEIGNVTEKVFTLFRLDGLLLGSIAAIITREYPNWTSHDKLLRSISWGLCGLFAVTLLLGSEDYTVRFTLISGIAVVWLLRILLPKPVPLAKRLLDNSPMRSLGKFSYAMYLFQLPLIPLMAPWFTPEILAFQVGSKLVAGLLYVAAMSLLTYVLAVISWHGFEKWFMNLRTLWDQPGPATSSTGSESKVSLLPPTPPKFVAIQRAEREPVRKSE